MIEIALSVLLAVSSSAGGGPWCDVVFKDVVRTAPVVIHAQADDSASGSRRRSSSPELRVVDVLKGRYDRETVQLAADRLAAYRFRSGDHVFLALDEHLALVDVVDGMGACLAVSVLQLRGGKLRPQERINYDYEQGALSLEALVELIEQDLHTTALAR